MGKHTQVQWKEYAGFGEPGFDRCEIFAIGIPGHWAFWSQSSWEQTRRPLQATLQLREKADAAYRDCLGAKIVADFPLDAPTLEPESGEFVEGTSLDQAEMYLLIAGASATMPAEASHGQLLHRPR